MISVGIVENDVDSSCAFPTNVTLENCDFIGNVGALLAVSTPDIKETTCTPNAYMKEYVHLLNTSINMGEVMYTDIVYFYNMAVYMNGNISISENLAL